MKKTNVANDVIAAGFVPRPVAPIQDLIQGTGVPAGVGGIGWRLRVTGIATSTEHVSAAGAPTV